MRMKFNPRELKIPFGKHRETGRLYDAGSVPNGRKCNCICDACGDDLEAVHPKSSQRQKYFRHVTDRSCKGGLESLFHRVAKQILKESSFVQISDKEQFSYNRCDIENEKYDKRPDAYVSNEQQSLIVEIFFWHDTKKETLDVYLKNGERVLKIDIRSERKADFNYKRLKELVLYSAPRKLYKPKPQEDNKTSTGSAWSWAPWIIGGGIVLYFFRKPIRRLFRKPVQQRKKRKRRY